MKVYNLGQDKPNALLLHDQRHGKSVDESPIPLPLKNLKNNPPTYNVSEVPKELQNEDRSWLKARFLKYLTDQSDGVPLARVVKAVDPATTERDVSEREYTSRSYNRAKRFFNRSKYVELRPEKAEADHEGGVLTAYPTPSAFHLIPYKQNSNADLKGVAERFISHIPHIRQKSDATYVSELFLKYLNSIDDKRLMLEDTSNRSQSSDLTMPYHTRFNNERRKADQWDRFNTAWDEASKKYDLAKHWTITTDPKRYDSLKGMVEGLIDAYQGWLEMMNRASDRDERLDFIRALEFTGSEKSSMPGLPHLHVVLFGPTYNEWEDVQHYFDVNKNHCEQVWVDPVYNRDGTWMLENQKQDGSTTTQSAAGYLGKYLSKTFEPIGETAQSGFNTVDMWQHDNPESRSEGTSWTLSPLWKMALYWATGRQFWDSSHSLKEDEPETLDEVPGLGETKLDELADHGINTFSDVRLANESELAEIDGITAGTAKNLKKLAGEPSEFDVGQYEFVGAANPREMPRYWSESATHVGIPAD